MCYLVVYFVSLLLSLTHIYLIIIILGGIPMECVKNTDIVKLIFKLKNIEKLISSTTPLLKKMKVLSPSADQYSRCYSLFHEGSLYFFQSYGFLKAQYFDGNLTPPGRNFLINNLYTPSYKTFLSLKQNLSSVQVDDIYLETLELVKEHIDVIVSSLQEVQVVIREI
jgi:hypothetical protein